MSQSDAPELVRAPIVEVVCGVRFKPIPAFDALRHGLFWSRIRDRYPSAEVHPLLAEPGGRIVSDVPLQRTWFVSADQQFVIQLQLDRLYVNWRKRGRAYPRFDEDAGVHARFDREFDGFRVFLRDTLDVVPEVIALELSKVDILERPADWTDVDDLARMIPRLASVVRGQSPEQLNVSVAVAQPALGGVLHTGYRTMQSPKGMLLNAEFRLGAPIPDGGASLEALFAQANERINAAFFAEFPDAEQRFGTGLQ